MDELYQELVMTVFWKNGGRLVRSAEAFPKSLARKRLVQIAIENRSIEV